jgi:hypothetical protein
METALTVKPPQFHGAVFRSLLNWRLARFELQADRVVVFEHSRWFLYLGLVGVILSRTTSGSRSLDIEYAKVASVSRGKVGLNKKFLDVKMQDGSEHRFNIKDDDANRIRAQVHQQNPTATIN